MSEAETTPVEQTPTTDIAPQSDENERARRLSRRIAIVALVFFVWYIAADRLTPTTNEARVRAFVVPMAPQVAGIVTEVDVSMNQRVDEGQPLVRIDPDNYRLAVQQAEADLEQAGQNVGASTADVASAQAAVVQANANLRAVQSRAERIIAIEDTGVVTQAEVDRARANIAEAQARVSESNSALVRAQQALGQEGMNNSAVQAAMARLEKAQLDLSRSVLYAPSNGGVSNVRVFVGYYANIGQPLMTFISATDVWVEANLRENNLGNLNAGDRVEMVLDVLPGRIVEGAVTSIGYGVSDKNASQIGQLATVETNRGWLRDAQRFPVIIHLKDPLALRGYLREAGQADVIVYTTGNWFMNAIGWCYIRLVSLMSYLY